MEEKNLKDYEDQVVKGYLGISKIIINSHLSADGKSALLKHIQCFADHFATIMTYIETDLDK